MDFLEKEKHRYRCVHGYNSFNNTGLWGYIIEGLFFTQNPNPTTKFVRHVIILDI